MLRNCKLYLILDTDVATYGRLLSIAKEAVRNGVDIVQLRDKKGLAKDILEFSRKIRPILKNRAVYIINDRIDLALAAGADGVHVGQEDLPLSIARKIMGSNALIGVSCQTMEQAKEAQQAGADYIGFGSVFKTLTKPHRQPMDLKLLSAVTREIKIPVFAIGGVGSQHIPLLRKKGVKRVAVCREICKALNIGRAVKLLNESLAN